MKNNIVYSMCFLLAVILFCSCEKDLSLYPQDKYSESTFFQSAGQFELFANQFYFTLPSSGVGQDVRSDILVDWSENTVSNGSYSPEPNSDLWKAPYVNIRNTTYLLEKAVLVPELADQINEYVGEAHFFRAFAYFELLRYYGGVPIIDKVLDLNDTELLYGPRNSREEVVAHILKDLDQAISLLPKENEIAEGKKGRVSREAALSFKGRVALFEGTWRKYRGQSGDDLLELAISATGEVINGNQYALFDRRDVLGDESYRYFFLLDKGKTNVAGLTKLDQKEYILANRFDADMILCTDGLPINKSPLFQGRKTVESEYENRDLRMTNILQKPFTRFWANNPPEYNRDWNNPFNGGNVYDINFGNTTRTGYYAVKFRVEVPSPFGVDWPVIRLAEVLLIHAEALFEKNGSITDQQLDLTINKLRDRAGLPALTNSFVSTNGLDMRTEIRRERTIELFLEGFRFDDLRRWKNAETEMPMALEGVLWRGTQYDTDSRWGDIDFPQNGDGYIIVEPTGKRKFEEKHYLFPLPTRQILLNPNLEQNPGWS